MDNNHGRVGRRPNTRVESSSPQMTDAQISAHAMSPAVRARCHHVCEAITTAATSACQLPRLRTRARWGTVSGGAGRAGAVDSTSAEGVDGRVVVTSSVVDGGAAALVVGASTPGSGADAPPRPSWLTPAKVPAPTTPTTSAATYLAPVAGVLITPVSQREMRRR